jgi:hypothetical protein
MVGSDVTFDTDDKADQNIWLSSHLAIWERNEKPITFIPESAYVIPTSGKDATPLTADRRPSINTIEMACKRAHTHTPAHTHTHPLTHTHTPTHQLTHSPTHPSTHPPTHPPTHNPVVCDARWVGGNGNPLSSAHHGSSRGEHPGQASPNRFRPR